MTPNSAHSLIDIVEGVDYTPGQVQDNVGGNLVDVGPQPPIFGLMCTKGGTSGNISIQLLGMDAPIVMPAQTFKQGVTYYFYLQKLVDDNSGDVKFVGMKYKNSPQIF